MPSTKRLAVKLGIKYKSKKATAAPVIECTSACGFVHSLNIAFIFIKITSFKKSLAKLGGKVKSRNIAPPRGCYLPGVLAFGELPEPTTYRLLYETLNF